MLAFLSLLPTFSGITKLPKGSDECSVATSIPTSLVCRGVDFDSCNAALASG